MVDQLLHLLYTPYFKVKNQDLKSQLVIVVGFLTLRYIFDIELLGYIALGLGLGGTGGAARAVFGAAATSTST